VPTRGLDAVFPYSTTAKRCFTRSRYRLGIPCVPSIAPPVKRFIIEAPTRGLVLK